MRVARRARTSTCPGCRRSNTPFVKTTPPAHRSRATSRARSQSMTLSSGSSGSRSKRPFGVRMEMDRRGRTSAARRARSSRPRSRSNPRCDESRSCARFLGQAERVGRGAQARQDLIVRFAAWRIALLAHVVLVLVEPPVGPRRRSRRSSPPPPTMSSLNRHPSVLAPRRDVTNCFALPRRSSAPIFAIACLATFCLGALGVVRLFAQAPCSRRARFRSTDRRSRPRS